MRSIYISSLFGGHFGPGGLEHFLGGLKIQLRGVRDAGGEYLVVDYLDAHDLRVDALVPNQLNKARGVAAALAGQDALVHALVAEHVLGVGVGEDVVDLDGDYLLRRDIGQQLEVVGLVRAYPVPGVEDELRVIGAGGFYDGPGRAHVGDAGIGHGLDAYHILPRPAAELGELLRVVLDGVFLHEAAVNMVHSEELAHMEANLLLVHLLVAAVVLGPERDVLDLGDGNAVLIEDAEYVLVVQPLGEGVDVGLRAQADALEAGGLGGGHALFKPALVAERPAADGYGVSLAHFYFLPQLLAVSR